MNKLISILLLVSGLLASAISHAGWGWGFGVGTGYYGPGYGPWYGPGYYGWAPPPSVVVTVPVPVPVAPAPQYYVRDCETVQICNQYDECWLERECN